MHLLYYSLAFALPILAASSSSPEEKEKPRTPCAVRSSTSGTFFDLNPVRLHFPDEHEKKQQLSKDLASRNTSWPVRGLDYGANFTLNICSPVLEKLDHVVGVPEEKWANISAFYTSGGKTYSMGMQNDALLLRGRVLTLNYTDGSPCPSPGSPTVEPRKILDGPEDDDDDDDSIPRKKPSAPKDSVRRKNTVIRLHCASDPLAPSMAVSFVYSPDSCTYVFEARTPAACGGIEVAQQQLGPAGVFGVIALVAVAVYFGGGCFYQRTVMHQRGWRQLPNYSLWAGIGSFFKDLFVIATSSCLRWVPAKRGYSRISNGMPNGGGRRGRDSEDENRLIDQLDEEWED
ncbi:mannose 6-phosphate receptor domain-containing protein [Myriangium duriaei CBS 260.36]|uniref:Mannose 6-phosphate receptor domain-containing protein n=1 Tax=Myriangium duriaei CBS 260.36 TaxID=1168546 RepID=A0A9P4J6E6_9PEZI|nr:mannose 6-phosphate receptor domain-containing protein [Myriangium duriaei CBS 260.36]